MSDSRSPAPADDPADSPAPENQETAVPAEKPAESADSPEPTATDAAAKTDASDAPADAKDTATAAKPPVDLEGVRAATMISISGGPKSSRLKWGLINLFIKLFKVSARFFPVILVLGGLTYSYTYFFGSIPIADKILTNPVVEKITSTPTVDSMLNKVGIDLPTKEERAEAAKEAEARGEPAEPQSRVAQMLQQTRDVVAASDARVNMGNALAAGDFSTAEAMLAEQDPESAEGTEATAPGTVDTNVSSSNPAATGAGGGSSPTNGSPDEAVKVSTYAGSNAAWAAFRDEADAAAAQAELDRLAGIEAPPAPPAPREVVYTSEVEPSPAFRAWLRSVQIGGMMPGNDPKAIINNMTFRPGEMIDYNLRVTFEGFAQDDTLIVFKDHTNAILTVPR
jgi:hypothetical protein